MDRYYPLHANLSFDQFKTLRSFPLVRLGKNKSGFISEVVKQKTKPLRAAYKSHDRAVEG